MITFLCSGLWHGANWTYVLWGGLNGIGQIIEEKLFSKKRTGSISKIISGVVVFIFWNFTMVFFRADTIGDALSYIGKFIRCLRYPSQFRQTALGLDKPESMFCIFFIIVLMVFDHASMKVDVIKWLSGRKPAARWAVYLVLIWVILMFMPPVNTSEFVYFQF